MTRHVFLGPMTLSWRAMALLAPIGLLAGLVSPLGANLSTRLAWLGATALAQVALTVVYAAGAVLRLGRLRAGVLIVVILGALARAASLVVLTAALGGIDPLGGGQRLIAGTVTFTLWGIAVGAALQSWTNYRAGLRALAASTDQALSEADDLAAQWRARLDSSGPSPQALAATARALHDDIDARLRPLSHRLWFSISDTAARQRLTTVTLTLPFQLAWISGLTFFLFTWNAWPVYGIWPSIGTGVLGLVVLNALLLLGQAMRSRLPSAAVLITLVTIVIATVAYAVVMALVIGITDPVVVAISSIAQIGEIIGIQLIAAVAQSRDSTVAELSQRTAALQDERAEVAAYLHSTVQARWTAAARRLEAASENGDVDSARVALAEARCLLEGVGVYTADAPGLMEVAASWIGIATVVIDAPADLPVPSQALISRIVDEAIANAVRHGEARRVDISIAVDDDRIFITAEDDGSGADLSAERGLGSEWLDTVATWSLTRTPAGSRLVAQIGV